MNKHPHKDRILSKLEVLLDKLAEEFDRHIDPSEGYLLGNDLRSLKTQVSVIREKETKGRRNYLKLV